MEKSSSCTASKAEVDIIDKGNPGKTEQYFAGIDIIDIKEEEEEEHKPGHEKMRNGKAKVPTGVLASLIHFSHAFPSSHGIAWQ